jgi:hypothetical protein
MYIADLTDWKLPGVADPSNLRAVGWIERGHDYTRGDVAPDLMRALMDLLVDPWQPFVSAGAHRCSLCRFTGGPGEVRVDSTVIRVGSNNVFIPGREVVYVAPSLIAHYMDAHAYSPPPEFGQAVMACPPMRSAPYLKALSDRSKALVAAGTHRKRL